MKKCVYARYSSTACRATGCYVIGVNARAILEMQHGNYLCKKHVVAVMRSMALTAREFTQYTELRERGVDNVAE